MDKSGRPHVRVRTGTADGLIVGDTAAHQAETCDLFTFR